MANGKMLAQRYELLERRGDGGMAAVYKGKDCLLNRYVAIKILKPEFIRDPKFVDNFRHESQAAARLSDPNIVSVYDVGRQGNIYYIVMELMEGESLGDIIKEEAPMSEKSTIDIARQVASGLSAAHKKRIIHRDIKPHNILMTEDGVAKIADFGIAKAVSGATVVSGTTTVMGSVHYLSPEQAKGGYVDARTDIYSLGIVMFEMLTGQVPFDGDNAVSVAMMHINNDVPAPSTLVPSISKAMDRVVTKAAARKPEDRYASADELMKALDDAETGVSDSDDKATKVFGVNDFYSVGPKRDRYNDGYDSGYNDSVTDIPKKNAGVSAAKAMPASARNVDDILRNFDSGDSSNIRKKNRERRKKKKRTSRRYKALAIVLALICAIPLSILILHGISGLGGDSVEVPDVLGMTEKQAVQALDDKGLDYEVGATVVSDKYDEGEVADMNPSAGSNVKKGTIVTLRLARGSTSDEDEDKVEVPSVTKLSLSSARTRITDADLKVGDITYQYSDSVDEGIIISQSPGPGDKIESGSSIDLTVSRGPRETTVEVPNLSNYTVSQAQAALERAGLSLGSVVQQHSSSVSDGHVISQGVSAGTSIRKGQSVSIVVSSGPDQASDNDSDNEDSDNGNSSDNNSSSSTGRHSSDSGNNSSSGGSSSSGRHSSDNGGSGTGGTGGNDSGSRTNTSDTNE